MHRLCYRASRILESRPTARYHICVPCASRIVLRPFTASTVHRDEEPKFVFNYYEESPSGKIEKVDNSEWMQKAEEVRARLKQEGKDPNDIETNGKLLDELLAELGEKEAQKLLEEAALSRRRRRKNNNVGRFGESSTDGERPAGLEVDFPRHHRAHLQSFNQVLSQVAEDATDVERNKVLWMKYVKCKQVVPDFLEAVPSTVWSVLWESQYAGNPIVALRTRHLWELVDDMTRARQELSPTQKLVRIESLFSRGDVSSAMKVWLGEWTGLSKDAASRADFRDLGIRLHVELDHLQEAYELALDAEKMEGKPEAGDFATIINSWVQKGDESSLKVAWSLYLRLRYLRGSQMSLEDYDKIFMAFLAAKQISLAFAVFKDMALSGKRPEWDSLELAKKSLGLYRELRDHTAQLSDLTQVSLAALSFMPKKLNNKFFFASWIKRLLGMGEVDSAVSVLSLMYERGIRPDAYHLNGVFSAWLRQEDKQNHNLALQVGWSMVKERLKVVARRNASISGEQVDIDLPDYGVLVPPYVSRNLPPATIETFSILLMYYENRSMHKSMEIVQQMLERAEIRPNAYFMNHILHADLRLGRVAEFWNKFRATKKSINPDLTTFSILWDCCKVFESGHHTPERGGFPPPRRLFATMVDWLSSQSPRSVNEAKREFDEKGKDFYNQIIRCFCHRRDLEGTLVALHALKDILGGYPNQDTILLITIQLARLGENVPLKRRRRSRFLSHQDSVRNMTKIQEIFKAARQARSEALQSQGIDEATLTVEQKREELLSELSEVLRIFMRHSAGVEIGERSPQEESIGEVTWEMGVGGIVMEPPLHSSTEPAPAVEEGQSSNV